MLDCKRGAERIQWGGINKKIIFLVTAIIIIFAASGVGAQEKATGTALMSAQEVISINVNQMDLQDVMRLIAEKADLNIIMGKEVTGMVTLRLKNVDLWQALEAILEVNGFTYREEKGIIRVVKSGKVIEGKLMLVTEVIALKYARAEDIEKACKHLLSSSGIMEIDDRTNSLIITDIRENIEKICQLIARLDTKLDTVPVFNLMGILSAPDYSLAMINDRILKVGETIEDFTVSEIGEDSITLKRGKQAITLRLREETHAVETRAMETQTMEAQGWITVASWQGNGMKNTEPFVIKGKVWRINWENLGSILQVCAYRSNGETVDCLVNTTEKGEGVSYAYESGEFYLTINAIGKWKITIEEQ